MIEHHLSRRAYDRLAAEYEELTTTARIEIARLIERARELGDLSENGDYHAAKDQQGMQEGRVRQLEAILKNAVIVEASEEGVVGNGSIVSIVYEGDSEDMAEKYLIGHIEERHDELDVISPGSPLGAALIGAQVGDTVEFEAPGGRLKVTVIDVVATA